MQLYTIVCDIYRNTRAIESGTPSKTVPLGFKPMPLHDAKVILPKCMQSALRINRIVPVEYSK